MRSIDRKAVRTIARRRQQPAGCLIAAHPQAVEIKAH
jgi:hypothetical protein